jgi:hypothetical protein
MQHMILMSKKMTSQNKLYEIKLVPYTKTLFLKGTLSLPTLAARGLEEPFFQLCCCGSVFWFWQEIGFGVTYVLRVQYSSGVVLVFWF